jgi:dTDP-4-dehydrorhamnose reductase
VKILVLGKEGQLARSLREVQRPDGMELVAIGRPDLDLTAPDTIASTIDRTKPQLVVNSAAYTAVDKAESERESAFAINATGAGRVAEMCAQLKLPIIHISTDYVFDGSKPAAYLEDDPVAPLGVYGRSKLEGERLVAAANPHHVILRTAWVISPFGNNFVKTMLRLAVSRDDIGVVDDQIGCPTHAPHLATAIVGIADRISRTHPVVDQPDVWGIYHAAGTGEGTWCDLAREIFRQSARCGGPSAKVRPITTAGYPTPVHRPANSRLDCGKLARVFGIRLPDWRQGVAECVTRLCSSSAPQQRLAH